MKAVHRSKHVVIRSEDDPLLFLVDFQHILLVDLQLLHLRLSFLLLPPVLTLLHLPLLLRVLDLPDPPFSSLFFFSLSSAALSAFTAWIDLQ